MAFFKKNAYFSLAVGIALLALILFLLIVGYAQIKSAQQKAKSAKKSAKIQVLVDSDAIASFVERVGGDAVRVEKGDARATCRDEGRFSNKDRE